MLLRRAARPLLAGIFVWSGIEALRDPKGHEEAARPVLDQLTNLVPGAEQVSHGALVRADAVVKVGAGTMLGFGVLPRLSATALAAGVVPTALAQQRFWEQPNPDLRRAERTQFLQSLGLLGGLMLAAADTGGRPSLAWRARRFRSRHRIAPAAEALTGRLADSAGESTARAGERLAMLASASGERATRAAERAGQLLADRADRLELAGHETAGRARKASLRARRQARKQIRRSTRRARRTADSVRSHLTH